MPKLTIKKAEYKFYSDSAPERVCEVDLFEVEVIAKLLEKSQYQGLAATWSAQLDLFNDAMKEARRMKRNKDKRMDGIYLGKKSIYVR